MRALVVFTALLMGAFGQKLFIGDQVLRIRASDEEQMAKIRELEHLEQLQIDFWRGPAMPSLPVDMRVPFTSLQAVKVFLETNNIAYTIMIDDVQSLVDQEQEEIKISQIHEKSTRSFNFASYHTLDEIYEWMDSFVSANAALVSKMTIGQSSEGRPLYVLRFSRQKDAKRPAIWLDMGIHSREWITQATGLWTANKIAATHTQEPLKSILDKMDIFVLLVTNPDGYVFTHTMNRMWRKTRSIQKGSSCIGVDPNRNWDAGFGGPGSSSNPCSETYHGARPHSEPEIQSIAGAVLGHGNVKVMLTIHSYSQMLLFPYGYKKEHCPDHDKLNTLAKEATDALAKLHNTKYTFGTTLETIYQADGTTTDWAYDKANVTYSYTFELRDKGSYGFLLPANQILPTAEETWEALKMIMQRASNETP
ncbi:carboxypeptidase A1-like [Ambystoma mexicanum]|uniref:carboxypeptidase A1-like n=1 Tax=Ambystoma mexicanum TaxID=8296 RepID=UPI0037E92F1B